MSDLLRRRWTAEDSAELYRIPAWGQGYFGVDASGHLVVHPDPDGPGRIDLLEVVEGLRERGLDPPVLIRFSDLLAHRIGHLSRVFGAMIEENGYGGKFLAVYPIKVNQERMVVEDVIDRGRQYGFGLEVGSKAELLAVLALTSGEEDRLIVCNGFKDERYIEAVVLAAKLDRRIIPVVEKARELDLILEQAERYGVRPAIGVRVKMAVAGSGRWRDSAGARSKFGLFVAEVLEVVDRLAERDMVDCLQLIHCHLGSQIQDIRVVKEGIDELSQIFVSLSAMGARIRFIDVGGGLAVDYDGSQTNYSSSMNYSLQEYASAIVYRLTEVCRSHDLEPPTIVAECGRALVAYHSVLVCNVVGSFALEELAVESEGLARLRQDPETARPVADLLMTFDTLSERRLIECYHDAIQARDEAMTLFSLGYLDLRQRAVAERLFFAICGRLRDLARRQEVVPDELEGLESILADSYFCNFSLFQSLPDSWAIGQLFPIVPIHRLDEEPGRRAVLADITCDSDGRIHRFVDSRETKRTLELHALRPGEDYYIGAFLVGAYQETLGDLHNLFGDTHVVHIALDESGLWAIEDSARGDTIGEVLSFVHYDVAGLSGRIARDCERAVRSGRMTVAESQVLVRFFDDAMRSYTYLEPGHQPRT